MRQLYIHVGPHKTGTTSIQAFLAQKRLELAGRGVAAYAEVVPSGAVQTNAWHLAHCFIRPELLTPMRLLGHGPSPESPAATEKIAVFRDWCRRVAAPTCVVSSESFCFLRTDQEFNDLNGAVSDLFDRITPILTIRDHAEWQRSWDHQLRAMTVWDRVAALPEHARVDGSWYFDVGSLRAFWARFGEVIEMDYAAAMRDHRSIIPPFREAIKVEGSEFEYDAFLNASPRA
jgi:hypothetical protein